MKYFIFMVCIVLLLGCNDSSDEVFLPALKDQVNFRSPGMQKCFEGWVDENNWENIEDVTKLACSHNGIDSIEGIEKLTNLEFLSLAYTALRAINLAQNVELEYLALNYNPYLKELDLSNNQDLKELYITYNSLEKVNLSNLTGLWLANIQTNMLKEVVVNNTSLENLWLGGNQVQYLALDDIRGLVDLRAAGNPIGNIDLSNVPELRYLDLSYTGLKNIELKYNTLLLGLDLAGNEIKMINLDANSELVGVDLTKNPLSEDAKLYLESLDWIEILEY